MQIMPSHADPRLDALCEQLRTERGALEEAVALVPPHLRQTRPAPDRWSVAEVLAHLAIVERRIAGLLGPLAAAAPAMTDPGAEAARSLDMAALLDRTRRFDAPTPLLPPADADAERAIEDLRAARAVMLQAIRGVDGRALETVQRAHPALGVLDGYQWIASVAGHEARHAAQIREIGAALAEPHAGRAG